MSQDNEQIQQQYIHLLNSALASVLLLECLDGLKNTNVYRQDIKQLVNRLERVLSEYSKDKIAAIWGVDDESMYKIMDYQKQFIKNVANMRPEHLGVINEIVELYKVESDKVLEVLNIKILHPNINQ